MADFLVGIFAPWARLYGDSTVIATVVGFVHLAGVLWGGGRAVTADAAVLRAEGVERFLDDGQLRFLTTSHRDVLIGLGLTALSGVLLVGSDVAHYLDTPLYWAKMAAVVLLLLNGARIKGIERGLTADNPRLPSIWARTRLHAGISMTLWFVVLLLGQGLVNL